LIVAGSQEKGERIAGILQALDYDRLLVVTNGGQARRQLAEACFGLIIICPPLADERGGEDFALAAAASTEAGILILTGQDGAEAEETAARLANNGILVVPEANGPTLFLQSLRLARAFSRRLRGLKQENTQLQQKIQDIRLIDRAKLILMRYLNMTEKQAHKYIERQSMDLRQPRSQIAQGILRTYEKE
jgi:response regulator NasT